MNNLNLYFLILSIFLFCSCYGGYSEIEISGNVTKNKGLPVKNVPIEVYYKKVESFYVAGGGGIEKSLTDEFGSYNIKCKNNNINDFNIVFYLDSTVYTFGERDIKKNKFEIDFYYNDSIKVRTITNKTNKSMSSFTLP